MYSNFNVKILKESKLICGDNFHFKRIKETKVTLLVITGASTSLFECYLL